MSISSKYITEVDLKTDRVQVYMAITHETWFLTHDENYQGNEFLIVDLVNDVNPTSETQLFNQITGLRG